MLNYFYMSQNLGNVLNIGTPKSINFPFGTNGKLMVSGVPILMHCKVQCGLKCVHSLLSKQEAIVIMGRFFKKTFQDVSLNKR